MESFSVIYKGPSVADDDERARRVARAIASRSHFTREEAYRRLSNTPFVLFSGLTRRQALRHRIFLISIGASIEVMSERSKRTAPADNENAIYIFEGKKWFFKGAARGFASALFSGLLLAVVILFAGIALILLSGLLSIGDQPLWTLSAIGWATIAFGLLIFVGVAALRIKVLADMVSPPDLSTPLKTLQSYYSAINIRHWPKAERCLAARFDSRDLGVRPRKERVLYFQSLSREFLFPRTIDPATATVLHSSESSVELRFNLDVISRKAASDGTQVKRTFVEVKRLVRIDDDWFLLDGNMLGQPQPSRLPLPACRECGTELELGLARCPVCEHTFSPFLVVEETALTARRNPDLAALLSAIIPGLGQAYNGQPAKGLLIAATFWMVLPWAAGVIDARRVAERINRNDSFHDVPASPFAQISFHLALIALGAIALFLNFDKLPMLQELFTEPRSRQVDLGEGTVRIIGPEARYTILFPRRWVVRETTGEEDVEFADGREAIRATSEDTNTTIVISSQRIPVAWEPCPRALAAKERLEASGAEVVNVKCGSSEGRMEYRVDSYSIDRKWRRSIIAIATGGDLFLLVFVCLMDDQEEMVPLFEAVADSIEFSPVQRPPVS